MACHAIHSWTLCGLVGAFLDLILAYLLLCGSALVFFASNFLSFFGLYLPCPCNGFFGDPNGSKCIQRFLVDCSTSKISSVHTSVMKKFPFDSMWMKDHQGRHLNVRFLRDSDQRRCDGFLEMEGEASCSSFSDARAPKKTDLIDLRALNSPSVRQGLFDIKGKGMLHQRPRSGALRRRRRAAFDPSWMIGFDASHSAFGGGVTGQEITEEDETSVTVNSGGDELQHDDEAPTATDLCGGTQGSFQFNEFLGESKNVEKDEFSSPELVSQTRQELRFDQTETNAIRVLEQALEEEHAACAALYLELEKERSAAATAADEAMAMILRLQKEKAVIEMEARQYQRMIEEKSAYDAEEMDILKEILLRREKEKHFLENEVEAYRQMMLNGNEQLEGDLHEVGMSGQRPGSLSEDPVLMLQQTSESISKKEMIENLTKSYHAFSSEKHDRALAFGELQLSAECTEAGEILKQGDGRRSPSIKKHHPHRNECSDEYKDEFQEKGILSMDGHPCAPQGLGLGLDVESGFCKLNGFQGQNLLEKTIIFVDEEQGQKDNARVCQGMAVGTGPTHDGTEISFPSDSADLEKCGKDEDQGGRDQHHFVFEAESIVHDVHVIDNKRNLCEQESSQQLIDTALNRFGQYGLQCEASGFRRVGILSDRPSTSRGETEPDIHINSSDMSNGLDKSQVKTLPFDLRRNSMSAVDSERLKLETEVGWLREKLRIVQQGRDKLSFPVEHQEREKIQLQLLEDIASQLREIRQLTEPGKAVRQASLPPSSSKVSSKKRRCRSVSWGVQGSS